MNAYARGSLVRLSAAFAVSAAATDPSTITFKVKVPAGTVTTYVYGTDVQVVKDSTGNYHVDWAATAEGIHAWRFEGTGTCQAAAEQQFTVSDSRFY